MNAQQSRHNQTDVKNKKGIFHISVKYKDNAASISDL